MKSSYSFEDRGTDRRNWFRNIATLKDLSNDIYDTKISRRRGKQYTSLVTLGGRHDKINKNFTYLPRYTRGEAW